MPTFYEEFGRRVARRRAILRLKQREVGQAIGSHRAHVSGLEHGRQRMMDLAQLMALAQVLQTSSDYLLQLVDEDPGVIPPWLCPGEAFGLHSSSPPLHTATPL
jgi:transcriptional regulator with XRE-family HTH domain